MKIKCPINDTSKCDEYDNATKLFRHLMDDHTDHAVTSYLVRKILKIHEKIEFYQNSHPECNIYLENTIEELKSLLEDKK